jgi:hypothetical protein
MLRSGVSFPVLMKLLGHVDPGMTMRYVDVALTDLEREFQLARSKPRHLAPQPKISTASAHTGLEGVIDALIAAQHVMEMFRRSLPNGSARNRLFRLSKRLIKILAEIRKLHTICERYLNPIPMQTERPDSEDFEDVRSYFSSTDPAARCVVG